MKYVLITNKTSSIMLNVILALLPGIAVLIYLYGLLIITNLLAAIGFALFLESVCLKLRHKNILFSLKDYSAIVTAVLLAVSLPPSIGLDKIFIGVVFAIVIAKHLYGGLGHNIFNPAMVGFLVLLIAYPSSFTNWAMAPNLDFSFFNSLNFADDISQATPLDPAFSKNTTAYLLPYYLINLSWLLGGLYLLYRKIIPWTLPLGFLIGIAGMSIILWALGNPSFNPLQQLFLGGSMLGAFFIVTDPVTAATTPIGKWIYSVLAGVFCILIREYCGYPDGVAFAIIFMNTWVPLINKLTIKSAFGYH